MRISLATVDDINNIQSFINSEWKKNHILSQNLSFFKYEYLYDNKVNFLLAKVNDEIHGVIGFIPNSIYNKESYSCIADKSDYCATLWKVKKNSIYPSLGLQLLQALRDLDQKRKLFCVGINEETLGLYKYLDIYTDKMSHYVMINSQKTFFKIAKISKRIRTIRKLNLDKKLKVKVLINQEDISKFDFKKFKNLIPFKNKDYFTKRYLKHPIYNYKVFGIFEKDDIVSLMVTRSQVHNSSKALRIIDFFGDEKNIKIFGQFLLKYIIEKNYEYADLYCFGIKSSILEKSGFCLVNENKDDIIIPNYFNPYVRENTPIRFFYDSKEIDKLRIFKGDGDQDRPS